MRVGLGQNGEIVSLYGNNKRTVGLEVIVGCDSIGPACEQGGVG